MPNLPSYEDLPGSGIPNPNRGNRKYKVYRGEDSQGNPGVWHIYYRDVAPQFMADPPPQITWGPAAPGAHVMNDPAPAPAPDPAPASTGGVQAPAAPERDWITNNNPGSPRNGQQYYVENGKNSDGDPGKWHIYKDGTKVFVADGAPAPTGGFPDTWPYAAPTPAPDGPDKGVDRPADPAPAGFPDKWPYAGSAPGSTGGAQAPDPAPAVDPSTGGVQAPDQTSVSNVSSDGGTGYTPTPPSGAIHSVAAGDTMWDIAQANDMSLDELKALNPHIENPNLIRPGDRINLRSSGADGAFPATSSYPSATEVVSSDQRTEVSGWGGDGTGDASDPANDALKLSGSPASDTDPLKINKSDSNSTA